MPNKQFYPSTFVAFLDILGFGEVVEHNSHAVLERLYENLLIRNTEWSLSEGKFVFVEQNGQTFAVADIRHIKVNSLVVSDSIAFWTEKDSMKGFVDIVSAVRNLLVTSLFCGLPLRGAITVGPLTMLLAQVNSGQTNLHQSLFGKSIVDAFNAEHDQQWSGCSISDACVQRYEEQFAEFSKTLNDMASLSYLVEKKLMVRYPVPRKGGTTEEFVINWVDANQTPVKASTVKSAFEMNGKTVTKPDAQLKLRNTLDFVRHINPDAEKPF
jgi:hypothetical protein